MVGDAALRGGHRVVAEHHVIQAPALHVEAIAGTVDGGVVGLEDVVHSPARVDLMIGEAVLIAVGPRIVDNRPVVALDVDPRGRGRGVHPGAVELVPGDRAEGRAFLDVDVFRGRLGDVVVDDDVVVALVGFATAVP